MSSDCHSRLGSRRYALGSFGECDLTSALSGGVLAVEDCEHGVAVREWRLGVSVPVLRDLWRGCSREVAQGERGKTSKLTGEIWGVLAGGAPREEIEDAGGKAVLQCARVFWPGRICRAVARDLMWMECMAWRPGVDELECGAGNGGFGFRCYGASTIGGARAHLKGGTGGRTGGGAAVRPGGWVESWASTAWAEVDLMDVASRSATIATWGAWMRLLG